MNHQHKDLASGRWRNLSLLEQMANVGSEVERAIKWKHKKNDDYFMLAFKRALELLDLTVGDGKNRSRLRELLRVREALVDHLLYDNVYHTDDAQWRKYFLQFNYACRTRRAG